MIASKYGQTYQHEVRKQVRAFRTKHESARELSFWIWPLYPPCLGDMFVFDMIKMIFNIRLPQVENIMNMVEPEIHPSQRVMYLTEDQRHQLSLILLDL